MAACLEEKLPTVKIKLPVVEEKCKYCLKSFDVSTGGRCMECHNGVFYCSRKCQVTELYIALILSEILKLTLCTSVREGSNNNINTTGRIFHGVVGSTSHVMH